MKKAQIQNMIIHKVEDKNSQNLSGRIAEFHSQIIECRLNQSTFTMEQKLAVISRIMENIKQMEAQNAEKRQVGSRSLL